MKIKKLLTPVIDAIIFLVIISSSFITIITLFTNKDGIPDIFGYSPFSIQSNSMAPTLKKGELIITKKKNVDELKEDDIISFYAYEQGQLIIKTHRIIKIENQFNTYFFTTKGDNSDFEDEVRTTEIDYISSYTNKKIPYLGTVLDFFKSKIGFFTCILIPLSLLFVYEIYDLIKLLTDKEYE